MKRYHVDELPSTLTFADHSTETSQYDNNSDPTIWTNRGGFGIVRCYDNLQRKVSETGLTGATNVPTSPCPNTTGATKNQTARPWDFYARTFAYDLSGRLTAADNALVSLGYTYDAAGRATARTGSPWGLSYVWDAASNLTSITYPDGSVFCFAFDALDRMSGASQTSGACPGSTTLASISYDPLGRRTGVTFGDSSTEAYGYDNADRLTSLAHAFPNDTTDDVTLTYGYDETGRELSKVFSNSTYAWSATTGTTGYTTANNLNQYQPTNSYSYLWWPEGPQKEDPAVQENYDEQGQLTLAYITSTPGTIITTDWWQAQTDALGHRMYHERQATAGTAYPLIYESTDGLRPEPIFDWQYSVLNGVETFQGDRRYVLGPDPDEYLAFRDFDSNQTLYYPHIDKEGTTIALSSGGSAVEKWTYDVYGQGSGAMADVGPGATTYPFRYTGQRLDPTTAFYNYKARDYSAALGRFLQPDPAGIDQGPNLYEYVMDDPADRGDPTGNDDAQPKTDTTTVSPITVTAARRPLGPLTGNNPQAKAVANAMNRLAAGLPAVANLPATKAGPMTVRAASHNGQVTGTATIPIVKFGKVIISATVALSAHVSSTDTSVSLTDIHASAPGAKVTSTPSSLSFANDSKNGPLVETQTGDFKATVPPPVNNVDLRGGQSIIGDSK